MSFELNAVPVLSRSVVDRAEEVRGDEQALRNGWSEAKLLRVTRRGQVRYSAGALLFDKAVELGAEPDPAAVFLGIDAGSHVWAVREDELSGEVADLRAMRAVDDRVAGLVTTAVALLNWHDHAGFHAADGSASTAVKGGWSRLSAGGKEEFPRIDPAVICLVHDGGDRVLLARQHTWPETLFSLLAGFVEAGESLERCVAREIREEVGVDVRDIHYLGSQPWPFPRSLMIGFEAVADPEQPLVFADGEIAEGYWFTRDEVRAALAEGDWSARREDRRLLLPGSISIARTIVESWAQG
ncbi:NAD(+) diphosphatase [Nocardia panacis]|uniref:NAD(+) diphosphatase n=1 Tax=Nocardia panacis TaxID=2340916 RepID=A0A3A4KWU0_9NOCA|nr:NAD(+) diphosphatase [Nocardia panacis]RJO79901.1 NAD(+) diphosphatase [Nocardia panacis]